MANTFQIKFHLKMKSIVIFVDVPPIMIKLKVSQRSLADGQHSRF